jgi:hypothetical protein
LREHEGFDAVTDVEALCARVAALTN